MRRENKAIFFIQTIGDPALGGKKSDWNTPAWKSEERGLIRRDHSEEDRVVSEESLNMSAHGENGKRKVQRCQPSNDSRRLETNELPRRRVGSE